MLHKYRSLLVNINNYWPYCFSMRELADLAIRELAYFDGDSLAVERKVTLRRITFLAKNDTGNLIFEVRNTLLSRIAQNIFRNQSAEIQSF